MSSETAAQKLCYWYLCIIPILVTILGFTTGHLNPAMYIPIWLLNFAAMIFATWTLGTHVFRSDNRQSRYLALAGAFLILPLCFLAILFSLGPPPDTIQRWVDTSLEQKVRFDALLVSGISVALGLSLLKVVTTERNEKFYSQLGHTAIMIAIPLFFVVTAFWHSFALESFKEKLDSAIQQPQPWYHPAVQQIWIITMGEVLLTWFAIALFAGSLRKTGTLRRTPALVYILFSTLAIVSILLYPIYPLSNPFDGFPYYPFMIPAMPITVVYYLGVNLVRQRR
jgi:hypothetical protein